MNNWEQLCAELSPLLKPDTDEYTFHQSFGECLKTIFHWDNGDVQHKVPVQIGTEIKRADTVVKGNGFGIVIEFKAPGKLLAEDDDFTVKATRQLWSYMKILGHKHGFLIGSKIRALYDDGKKTCFFGFQGDDPDGVTLGELLDKSVCSTEKLKEFVVTRDAGEVDPPAPDHGKSTKPSARNLSEVISEVISVYNRTYPDYPVARKGVDEKDRDWGQIFVEGWPLKLHYEFFMREKGKIGIELHYESRSKVNGIPRWESSGAKKTFEAFHGVLIGKYKIEKTPEGKQGIYISVPLYEGAGKIAELMHDFIGKTRERVHNEVKIDTLWN